MASSQFMEYLQESFKNEIIENVDIIIDRGIYCMRKNKLLEAFILLFSAVSYMEKSYNRRVAEEALAECNNALAVFRGDIKDINSDLSKYIANWSILAYTHFLVKQADQFYK